MNNTKWDCIRTEDHSCDPAKKQCCDGFECKRMAFGTSAAHTVHVCVPKDNSLRAQVGDPCGKDDHCSSGYCHKKDCASVNKVIKGSCENTRGFCAIQNTLSQRNDFL